MYRIVCITEIDALLFVCVTIIVYEVRYSKPEHELRVNKASYWQGRILPNSVGGAKILYLGVKGSPPIPHGLKTLCYIHLGDLFFFHIHVQ